MRQFVWNRLVNTSHIFVDGITESVRDGGTVLIFFVAVILYPVLYSVGYMNQTINDIPIAVVDNDHSALSRQYTRMLDATEQLRVSCKPGSLKEAEPLFLDGKIHGVVLIPEDFEKELLSHRQTDVLVYCDAGKFLVYKQVYTASSFATATLNAGAEIKSSLARGRSWDDAYNRFEGLNAQFFELYNPSSGYCTFIVPGILIIVIQQSLLVGIGLLFGKNNERRKPEGIDDLLPAGARSVDIVIGKAAAYVVLYLFTTLITLVLLYHWLSFPEKGSFWQVYLVLLPFLFAVSFMGIAIGTLFKRRVHSLIFIVFISPLVFFLTGVAWPNESLPNLLKMLSYVFPTTPMIPAFIKLRLTGGGVSSIKNEWIILMVQFLVYFIIALVAVHFSRKSTGRNIIAKAV